VFGQPITIRQNTVAALVTNTTDQVKSFTVKATYKNGDTILATASGAVNDLRPGQRRAVTLVSSSPLPSTFESVRLDVDTMVRDVRTTPAAEAAAKLRFGPPAIRRGNLPTMDVEVRNEDTAAHSFTVQAAFLKGGNLVGVASGAVNDLEPGQTKTASLVSGSTIPEYDDILLAVDTLVR